MSPHRILCLQRLRQVLYSFTKHTPSGAPNLIVVLASSRIKCCYHSDTSVEPLLRVHELKKKKKIDQFETFLETRILFLINGIL